MSTHAARIRTHTRVSKNGKRHQVRAHTRQVTFTEMLRNAAGNMKGAKPVGVAAMATAAGAAITYTLYGLISLTAAIMLAIALISTAFITWAIGANTKKRKQRRSWWQRNMSGALSPKRRIKHWWTTKTKRTKRKILPKWLHT